MKAPAFQFYPGDFILSTNDMTSEEVGGYMRLLCHQWGNGGLPDNLKKIEGIARISGDSLACVLEKFKKSDDGLLKNNRLELVRDEQNAFRAKQKEKAEKRWSKTKQDDAGALPGHMPNTMPEPCPNDALHSSSSTSNNISTIPTEPKGSKKDAEFIELFNELTKRSFKTLDEKAKRQLDKLRKGSYTKEDLVKAITAGVKDSKSWPKPNLFTPEYITRESNFIKYLNWEPEVYHPAESQPNAFATLEEKDDYWGGRNPNFKPSNVPFKQSA